jgi:hypothetical protein
MSDTKENVGNGADKSDGTPKVSDTEFMMVCFKNIQGSVSVRIFLLSPSQRVVISSIYPYLSH